MSNDTSNNSDPTLMTPEPSATHGLPSKEPFEVIFVTTPARVKTLRFKSYFEKAQIDQVKLIFCLKRREPKMGKDAMGHPLMGWTESCTPEEFEEAAAILCAQKEKVCINVENEITDHDRLVLKANPKLGLLMSGTGLSIENALAGINEAKGRDIRFVALETEALILSGPELLDQHVLTGLVIGTSYLSESSQMYDQLGFDRYRALMRSLSKKAASMGVTPYSTGSYCTFEPTGLGDKSKDYVKEQVEFLLQYKTWGSITRYYNHLDTVNQTNVDWKGTV